MIDVSARVYIAGIILQKHLENMSILTNFTGQGNYDHLYNTYRKLGERMFIAAEYFLEAERDALEESKD